MTPAALYFWLCYDVFSVCISFMSTILTWNVVYLAYVNGVFSLYVWFYPAPLALFVFHIACFVKFARTHLQKSKFLILFLPVFWCMPVIVYLGRSGAFQRWSTKLGLQFHSQPRMASFCSEEWQSRRVSHAWLVYESVPQFLNLLNFLAMTLCSIEQVTSGLNTRLTQNIFILLSTLAIKPLLYCFATEGLHIAYLCAAFIWTLLLCTIWFAWVIIIAFGHSNSWYRLWFQIGEIGEISLASCFIIIGWFLILSPIFSRFFRASRKMQCSLCAITVTLTPIWLLVVNFLRLRFVVREFTSLPDAPRIFMRSKTLLRFFKSDLRFSDWLKIACPVSSFPVCLSSKMQAFNRVMANKCLLREHASRRIFESAGKAVLVHRLARALVLQSHLLKTKDGSLPRARGVLREDIKAGLELCSLLTRKSIELQQRREMQETHATMDSLSDPLLDIAVDSFEESKTQIEPPAKLPLAPTFYALQQSLGLDLEDADETGIVRLLATQSWVSAGVSKEEFVRRLWEYRETEDQLSDFVLCHPELAQQIKTQANRLRADLVDMILAAKDELTHSRPLESRWRKNWRTLANEVLHCFPSFLLSTKLGFYMSAGISVCVGVLFVVARTFAEWYLPLFPVFCICSTEWGSPQPLVMQVLSIMFLSLSALTLALYPFYQANWTLLRNANFFDWRPSDSHQFPLEIECAVMDEHCSLEADPEMCRELSRHFPADLVELCRQYHAPRVLGLERWREAEQAAWLVSEVCHATGMKFESVKTFPLYACICDILESKTPSSREVVQPSALYSREATLYLKAGAPLRHLNPARRFQRGAAAGPTGIASLDLLLSDQHTRTHPVSS